MLTTATPLATAHRLGYLTDAQYAASVLRVVEATPAHLAVAVPASLETWAHRVLATPDTASWVVDVLGNHWRPLSTSSNRLATSQDAVRYVRVEDEESPRPQVATAVEIALAYGYARRIPAPVSVGA